jgi:hypothetical protein
MKIRFNFEIKKVRDMNNIEEVRALCKVAFGTIDQSAMKFWYVDSDNDIISVSSQDDYIEFLTEMQGL